MKKAFTMIELIFVIVILGILAAVALPKFLGVSQQAHEANLKSFVGTLNRTVGPTLWSKSISDGKDGNISYTDLEYYKGSNDNNLTTYIDMPKEIQDMNLSQCDDPNSYKIVGYADKGVAGANYFIACKDGNANQSPMFVLYKETTDSKRIPAKLGDKNATAFDANPAGYNADGSSGSYNEKGTLLLK